MVLWIDWSRNQNGQFDIDSLWGSYDISATWMAKGCLTSRHVLLQGGLMYFFDEIQFKFL